MNEVLAAGVGIVPLPAANLFLQARGSAKLPARGLTRVADLIRLGVPVATASDNIQDAFVPVGSGDMLEIARWTILAAQLGGDATNTVFDMVTSVPGRLMDLEPCEMDVGNWATFLVTPSVDVADLVRSGPLQREVFFRGSRVPKAPWARMGRD